MHLWEAALIATLGLYMIQQMGAIGGAWFWIFQAAVFTPMLRLPLIYQELRTLEFVGHVWQPIVSAAAAALCTHNLRVSAPALDSIIAACVVHFVLMLVSGNKISGPKKA